MKLVTHSVFYVFYIFLFQESDFDFVDRQHLEGIKVGDILSSQAMLDDDEDLMNDQGSGPFVEYSGTTEIVSSTQFASTKPVFPHGVTSPARNHTGDLGKRKTSTVINCCCTSYSRTFIYCKYIKNEIGLIFVHDKCCL